VPELQGEGSLARRSWRLSSRLLAGTALGVAGLGLLARELTRRRSWSAEDTGTSSQAVSLQKTIYVDAPLDEVFELWANFETFPRFMSNVLEVRDLGEGRSHWVVRGPAGSRIEWDAEVTRFEPNRVLAWQTEPGAVVESSGLVHFEREGDSTRVQVRMSYHPPAGVVGHGVATFLGSDPEKLMDEDLVRFKSLVEDGKTTARGETVRREEVESDLHQHQLEPVHF
jgi:uncharacterized membrane protein